LFFILVLASAVASPSLGCPELLHTGVEKYQIPAAISEAPDDGGIWATTRDWWDLETVVASFLTV
jgi:hypothetical protein